MTVSEEEVLETKQLLTQLEKTHKTLRLYHTDNEVTRRLEGELMALADGHLERWGETQLAITERSVALGDEVVYSASDRTDSLAFLFYRDGIRRLRLVPGLEPSELRSFLEALNRVSVVANEADDLVTLFWECDFAHIDYFAVEELHQEYEGPSIEEQLASGSLGTGAGSAGDADAVSLDDLKPTATRLPIRECVLTEEEVEALIQELVVEEEQEQALAIIDLAVELTLLEGSDEDRQIVRQSLSDLISRTIETGPARLLMTMMDRLLELAYGPAGGKGPQDMLVTVREELAAGERVARFFELADTEARSLSPESVTDFLRRLGVRALPAIVASLGTVEAAAIRRCASEAVIAASGGDGVDALCGHIGVEEVPNAAMVAEMLYVSRRLEADDGMRVVRRLLQVPNAEVRRQAAKALGPYKEGTVGEIWVQLLADGDPEMHGLALTALMRGGRPELAQPIADHTMTEDFESFGVEDKKRSFAAIARLGGETSLPLMREIISRPHRRHFLPRAEKDLIAAVAHGITQLGPAVAQPVLEELSASSDRHVRSACRKALKEMDNG